jgi:hypothetical protein
MSRQHLMSVIRFPLPMNFFWGPLDLLFCLKDPDHVSPRDLPASRDFPPWNSEYKRWPILSMIA